MFGMDTIPWGFQLLVNFAVPAISAVGAYIVAERVSARSEKTQLEDRLDRENVRKAETRNRSMETQRRAVQDFLVSIRAASAERGELINSISSGNSVEKSQREAILVNSVPGFYTSVLSAAEVLDIELREEKVRDVFIPIFREFNDQWSAISDLLDVSVPEYRSACLRHFPVSHSIASKLVDLRAVAREELG